jgi:hypothetical protein
VLEFGDERVAGRLGAALAFGAVTARVLAPRVEDGRELLCAIFNLGIGLVDSLGDGDGDTETGAALLESIHGQGLTGAAEEPRPRGWLGGVGLADDPTVAFTVAIVEAFFATLHASYPGGEWLELRRVVGELLGAALEAERRSLVRSADGATRAELTEASRLTSVLPFEIVETLASGGRGSAEATELGEAMWRIDDLVDLCQDARSGALNAVLLGAPGGFERLLDSTQIADAAAEAAAKLEAGLARADPDDAASFLAFVQRYAGIEPRPAS